MEEESSSEELPAKSSATSSSASPSLNTPPPAPAVDNGTPPPPLPPFWAPWGMWLTQPAITDREEIERAILGTFDPNNLKKDRALARACCKKGYQRITKKGNVVDDPS